MNITVKEGASGFRPKSVSFILNTPEEWKHFCHIFGCWGNPGCCTHKSAVSLMTEKIIKILEERNDESETA